MSDDPQTISQELHKPRVSVSVSLEYHIDPRGTAKVKDTKNLKNDGLAPAKLSGEFKQAINHNATQIRIFDSHAPDRKYPFKIIRGDDHHQVAVAIEVPEGTPFTIEPGTERSLTFEYEMSGATTTLTGDSEPLFLLNNRFGSVTYRYNFATIEYNVQYIIAKLSNAKWWQRIFLRPVLLWHPSDMTVIEDRTHFRVDYHFSGDPKSVKYVHMVIILRPRFWVQWTTAFLIGAASSAAIATAPQWLRSLEKLFSG
jgi:hypothetical protein